MRLERELAALNRRLNDLKRRQAAIQMRVSLETTTIYTPLMQWMAT